jgi:hypothetical protein
MVDPASSVYASIAMAIFALESLFAALKDLRAAWPSRGFSWDTRMTCVTSSINAEIQAKARTALAVALPTEWTSTSIAQAPPGLRDLAERTGGLRSGQLLLVSLPAGSTYAYGLWWPWGDGITTSVRIGLGGSGATNDAQQRLRDAFGVEP